MSSPVSRLPTDHPRPSSPNAVPVMLLPSQPGLVAPTSWSLTHQICLQCNSDFPQALLTQPQAHAWVSAGPTWQAAAGSDHHPSPQGAWRPEGPHAGAIPKAEPHEPETPTPKPGPQQPHFQVPFALLSPVTGAGGISQTNPSLFSSAPSGLGRR